MIINNDKPTKANKIEPIRAGKLIKILENVPTDALVCFKDYSMEKKKTHNEKEVIKDYILQNQIYSDGTAIKQIILTNKPQNMKRD